MSPPGVVVAVDLAARYSAACVLDRTGAVVEEFDSWHCSESDFIARLADRWRPDSVDVPEILVVEDLPHRLPFSSLVKRVCRLQGRIVHEMHNIRDAEDRVLFVPPAEWRKTYDGMGRGTGPDIVTPVSAQYGYTPPDLSVRAAVRGSGGKSVARKVATDYCAAYLIGRWALSMHHQHHTYDVLGTHRYGQHTPTKQVAQHG